MQTRLQVKTPIGLSCDSESTRYALSGAMCYKGKDPFVAATTGRMLAVVRVEGECEENVIIPMKVLPTKAEAGKKHLIVANKHSETQSVCTAYVANGKCHYDADSLDQPTRADSVTTRIGLSPEGRFPRVHEVIPSLESDGIIGVLTVDPQLLLNLHASITKDKAQSQSITLLLRFDMGDDRATAIQCLLDAEHEMRHNNPVVDLDSVRKLVQNASHLLNKPEIVSAVKAIPAISDAGFGVIMPMTSKMPDPQQEIQRYEAMFAEFLEALEVNGNQSRSFNRVHFTEDEEPATTPVQETVTEVEPPKAEAESDPEENDEDLEDDEDNEEEDAGWPDEDEDECDEDDDADEDGSLTSEACPSDVKLSPETLARLAALCG